MDKNSAPVSGIKIEKTELASASVATLCAPGENLFEATSPTLETVKHCKSKNNSITAFMSVQAAEKEEDCKAACITHCPPPGESEADRDKRRGCLVNKRGTVYNDVIERAFSPLVFIFACTGAGVHYYRNRPECESQIVKSKFKSWHVAAATFGLSLGYYTAWRINTPHEVYYNKDRQIFTCVYKSLFGSLKEQEVPHEAVPRFGKGMVRRMTEFCHKNPDGLNFPALTAFRGGKHMWSMTQPLPDLALYPDKSIRKHVFKKNPVLDWGPPNDGTQV